MSSYIHAVLRSEGFIIIIVIIIIYVGVERGKLGQKSLFECMSLLNETVGRRESRPIYVTTGNLDTQIHIFSYRPS